MNPYIRGPLGFETVNSRSNTFRFLWKTGKPCSVRRFVDGKCRAGIRASRLGEPRRALQSKQSAAAADPDVPTAEHEANILYNPPHLNSITGTKRVWDKKRKKIHSKEKSNIPEVGIK